MTVRLKSDFLIIARYDTTECFKEEVNYVLQNIEEHLEIFDNHEKLARLASLFLPDNPKRFNIWVKKLEFEKDLRILVEYLVQEWEYMDAEIEQCFSQIKLWFHNVPGPYILIERNSKRKILNNNIESAEFFEIITDSSDDIIFNMRGHSDYAMITICHDRFSSAKEIIYVRPIKDYISSKLTYSQILKIIRENKLELTYWNKYPEKLTKKSMLECIALAIEYEMISWEWSLNWINQ